MTNTQTSDGDHGALGAVRVPGFAATVCRCHGPCCARPTAAAAGGAATGWRRSAPDELPSLAWQGWRGAPGLRTWYEVMGEGSAPPAIICHGGPGATHEVFYARHVCRLPEWPEAVARSFAAIQEDPTVYGTI